MAKKPRKKILLQLIDTHLGVIAEIAKACGVARSSANDWINSDPDLKERVLSCRESLIDLAEFGLKKHLENGSEKSIHFVLGTIGKNRGYVHRFETRDKSKFEDQLNDMTDEELEEMLIETTKKIKGGK